MYVCMYVCIKQKKKNRKMQIRKVSIKNNRCYYNGADIIFIIILNSCC